MNTAALRTLIIYAIILPLAVFIGWKLSGDMTRSSFAMLAIIGFLLLLPLLLKWHYPAMILSWNTAISIFFLPGKPTLWILLACINFAIAVFHRIIQKRQAFISAPSVTIPLLVLGAVVLMTGRLRGGFGLQSLGSGTYGGKFYVYIIGAIIGYMAFVSQRIPVEKAKTYVGLFLLPGLIAAVSNLIYLAGPSFYFLYLIVPAGFAGVQASTDASGIVRVAGLWVAGSAVVFYFAAVHGIRGILQKWWRPILLLAALAIGTLAGYRSILLMFAILFIFLFVLEGLLRSPLFPALILVAALAGVALIPLARHLPRTVQRTLSILPLDVDPFVRRDAQASIDWRLEIWRSVLPDLPRYIWLGKGYSINPTDLYLAQQASLRGRTSYTDAVKITGDYHNGPLSVFVPFGSFGLLAFIAFLVTSLRALYLNYRYGSEELKTINRFLFAFFGTKTLFFFAIFGSLHSDMYQFVGTIGMGIALNNGICRKPAVVPMPVRVRGSLELRPAI